MPPNHANFAHRQIVAMVGEKEGTSRAVTTHYSLDRTFNSISKGEWMAKRCQRI